MGRTYSKPVLLKVLNMDDSVCVVEIVVNKYTRLLLFSVIFTTQYLNNVWLVINSARSGYLRNDV